jgi:hypothetical protein
MRTTVTSAAAGEPRQSPRPLDAHGPRRISDGGATITSGRRYFPKVFGIIIARDRWCGGGVAVVPVAYTPRSPEPSSSPRFGGCGRGETHGISIGREGVGVAGLLFVLVCLDFLR